MVLVGRTLPSWCGIKVACLTFHFPPLTTKAWNQSIMSIKCWKQTAHFELTNNQCDHSHSSANCIVLLIFFFFSVILFQNGRLIKDLDHAAELPGNNAQVAKTVEWTIYSDRHKTHYPDFTIDSSVCKIFFIWAHVSYVMWHLLIILESSKSCWMCTVQTWSTVCGYRMIIYLNKIMAVKVGDFILLRHL